MHNQEIEKAFVGFNLGNPINLSIITILPVDIKGRDSFTKFQLEVTDKLCGIRIGESIQALAIKSLNDNSKYKAVRLTDYREDPWTWVKASVARQEPFSIQGKFSFYLHPVVDERFAADKKSKLELHPFLTDENLQAISTLLTSFQKVMLNGKT